jgi:hypothetical protein
MGGESLAKQLARLLQASLICAAVVAMERPAIAQNMFAGYDAFCGVRVIVGRTNRGALALRDAKGPLIYVDRGVMANWTSSRLFTLAHECAHHKLGHSTPVGLANRMRPWGTRKQELEADCWAVGALMKIGKKLDIVRVFKEQVGQGHMYKGSYPTGQERALNIIRCSKRCHVVQCAHVLHPRGDLFPCRHKAHPADRIPCQHLMHPGGDVSPCRHIVHPVGDLFPCRHACPNPYAPYGPPVRCHPRGDLLPCRHRVHPMGDVSPCRHRVHPNGDMIPCRHKAHPVGDLRPCQHRIHEGGDVVCR